jgi:non-canonical (house-cleaning) NTP pyrophosphatase
MDIIIGTKNKAKVAIVEQVMAELLPDHTLHVQGIDIESGVPDTPRGEETKTGAYNRAVAAAQSSPTYSIGIESGLVERYGAWFEEAWACVILEGNFYYGYSSGLSIPKYVLRKMHENDVEHGPAMHQIRNELHQHDDRDTWGTYSDKLILRDVSLQEALRNALIQTLPSKNSLYHL